MLVVSSDNYPPTRVDVAVLFGEELAGRGHHIDWILQSEAHCTKSYVTEWGGGKVWVGATDTGPSLLSSVRRHFSGIVNDMKLVARLRTREYQLIEVKDKFLSGVVAAAAARWYGVRFVYWLSYPFPEEYLYRASEPGARHPVLYRIRGLAFRFLLYRVLLPAADHVFVQSEQMRLDVGAEGVPAKKMTVVPMGIKIRKESTAISGLRNVIPAGQKCFLYLGTLGKVRRMDFLIRVLAHVLKKVPDARLYLVGRGNDASDEQILIDEASRLGVQQALVFVGQLPQVEALRFVQEADICVSPIFPTPVLNVGSPTKLVEYMAMGKAVVANDHPEQKLILQESGGGICVPWNEEAFGNAIVSLLESPETALAMGARGREYALRHRAYDRIADVVERSLLSLANEQAPS